MREIVPLVDDDIPYDSSEVFVLTSASLSCPTSTPSDSSCHGGRYSGSYSKK